MTDVAISTTDLGKRYGNVWALRECSIEVPTGRVSGLVGANGAGKTTLMRLLAGLSRPTAGDARVGGRPPADNEAFLRGVGYLAQDVPLYPRWDANDHLAMGAHMNPRWDAELARDRLLSLRIPLDRPVRSLSGGMRAQVALALALGKRPEVLLLDEPVAALDPLARREFLASLTAAVADGGVTVLLSSHLLPDLERVCDHLIVLADGRPIVCADIDELLASHKVLSAAASDRATLEPSHQVVTRARTQREISIVARVDGPLADPAWRVDDLNLEDIVLAYLGQDNASAARIVEEVR